MFSRRFFYGGPNGNRTRVLDVRGRRPRPLDDGTITFKIWLGDQDSNLDSQIQSLVSCHWTIPQNLVRTKKISNLIMLNFYFSQDKLFLISAEHVEKKLSGGTMRVVNESNCL
jgi:hypothetical protein